MIYERVLRPLLFALDPETAHQFTLACLRYTGRFLPQRNITSRPISVFGLNFKHRVGLAAGLDKNGVALPAWEALGFSFAEIGTVTARPQPGNPPPRIFRFPRERGLINRLGFNNDGAERVAARLTSLRADGRWPRIPIGINIGKSAQTPLENAVEDYLFSYRKLRDHADYTALNISSPNTPGLRDLQSAEHLKKLLRAINAERAGKPVLVKIAPDLDSEALEQIAHVCAENSVSGIIATNTTLDHSSIPVGIDQAGGLSGAPLRGKSTAVVRQLAGSGIPIIGCGGIFAAESAREKIDAGATLLQVYTGFIYRGPELLRELARL